MSRDGEAVPAVDRDDRVEQGGELLGVEVLRGGLVRAVDVAVRSDRVSASVSANAARSRSLNSGDSRQAATANSRRWLSPAASASWVCWSTQ
jgi:hypothetical protein